MTQQNNVFDSRRLSLKATAFHEAGHALSALHHGLRFSKVWILERKETDTFADGVNIGEVTRADVINKPSFAGRLNDAKVEAVQAMAGPIAECLPYPDMQPDWALNANDMRDAVSILKFALLPFTIAEDGQAKFDEEDQTLVASQMNSVLQECYQRAVALVTGNIPAIDRIAQALLKKWSLTEAEVREIVQSQ